MENKYFNPQTILDLFDQDHTVINELLQTFLSEGKNSYTDIQKAVENEDYKQLHFLIHKIKPSIQYFGSKDLCDKLLSLDSLKPTRADSYENFLVLFDKLLVEAEVYHSQNGTN